MATEVVTRPTASHPRPTKSAAQNGPATTLTVPAKPALVTGANVAALAGTAAVAAGPVGWAVAAGVAAAAGGGYVVRRAVVRRTPATGSADRGTAGGRQRSGLRLPGSGRATTRTAAAAGGTGRRGAATPAGTGRSPSGRTTSSPSASGRRSLNPLNALRSMTGRRALARGASPGSGRTRTGAGTSGRSGRGIGSGPLGRASRSAGRLAAAPARALWSAAKQRRAARRAASASAGRATSGRWNRMRRFVRRHILGQQPPTRTPSKTQPAPGTRRSTGDQVRRSRPAPGAAERAPAPRPMPIHNRTNGRPSMSSAKSGNPPQPSSPFYHAARQVHAAAAQFEPRGMMQVRTEAYEMPHSLGEIAAALRVRAQACTKQPLHPQLAQAIAQVASCVDAAAQAARQIGPAFDGLHPTEVARVLQPRPNEQAWDVANNRP